MHWIVLSSTPKSVCNSENQLPIYQGIAFKLADMATEYEAAETDDNACC